MTVSALQRLAKRVYRSNRIRETVNLPPWSKVRSATISIDSILMGGEGGLSAVQYSKLTDNILRPSTSVARSPHLQLLKDYEKYGAAALEDRFMESTYFNNAREVIETCGSYFSITEVAGLKSLARSFVEREIFGELRRPVERPGYSRPDAMIEVLPIAGSDCYQLVDGNHRLAGMAFRGRRTAEVAVVGDEVLTPAQELLLNVNWQDRRFELYQPVRLPEVATWTLVRGCQDRFGMMRRFLADRYILSGSYLDMASSYGWFVKNMSDIGFVTEGVELDPNANLVGQKLYGIPSAALQTESCLAFLGRSTRIYDVVSMFSILHHFAMGRAEGTAEELIGAVDKIVGKVLFFDTGQMHEAWFAERLKGWDDAYIVQWLRKNTTFSEVISLGRDSDNCAPFKGNYSRALFACVR